MRLYDPLEQGRHLTMNNREFGGRLQKIRTIRRLDLLGFAFVCLVGMTACNRKAQFLSEQQPALMMSQ
jgi:hypothetical protein